LWLTLLLPALGLSLLLLALLLSLSAGVPVSAAFLTATAMLSGCRLRDQGENPCNSKRAQG